MTRPPPLPEPQRPPQVVIVRGASDSSFVESLWASFAASGLLVFGCGFLVFLIFLAICSGVLVLVILAGASSGNG